MFLVFFIFDQMWSKFLYFYIDEFELQILKNVNLISSNFRELEELLKNIDIIYMLFLKFLSTKLRDMKVYIIKDLDYL